MYSLLPFILCIAVVACASALALVQRKVPVSYSSRRFGNKVYSGGTSFLPLRLNYAGVVPVIVVQALMIQLFHALQTISLLFNYPMLAKTVAAFSPGSLAWLALIAILVFAYNYLWVTKQFDENALSTAIQETDGFIPGVLPGKPTASYLAHTFRRITFAGSFLLVVVCVAPVFLGKWLGLNTFTAQFLGATGLFLLTGEVLNTLRQAESYALASHYASLLRKRYGDDNGAAPLAH